MKTPRKIEERREIAKKQADLMKELLAFYINASGCEVPPEHEDAFWGQVLQKGNQLLEKYYDLPEAGRTITQTMAVLETTFYNERL